MMSEGGLLDLVLSCRQAVPSRTEFGLTCQLAVSYGQFLLFDHCCLDVLGKSLKFYLLH